MKDTQAIQAEINRLTELKSILLLADDRSFGERAFNSTVEILQNNIDTLLSDLKRKENK